MAQGTFDAHDEIRQENAEHAAEASDMDRAFEAYRARRYGRYKRMKRADAVENAIRSKAAFICMAAVVGKEGDMKQLTDELVVYCRNLI